MSTRTQDLCQMLINNPLTLSEIADEFRIMKKPLRHDHLSISFIMWLRHQLKGTAFRLHKHTGSTPQYAVYKR